MRFLSKIRAAVVRSPALGIMIACLLLITFIGFLVTSNYRSQRALQEAGLTRFRLDLEKRAVSLGYFFSERKHDLHSMASSREIDAYFFNKSLGMSEQYGLRVNLFAIDRLFKKTLTDKTIQDNAIYERFLLLDQNKTPLVDVIHPQQSKHKPFHRNFQVPGQDDFALYIKETDEGPRVVMTASINQKDQLEGLLVAWLNPGTILSYFIGQSSNFSDKGFILVSMDGMVIFEHDLKRLPLLEHFRPELLPQISAKDFTKLSFEAGGKGRVAAKFIRVAVHDMPLDLLAWVKPEQYLGNPILWRLLAGTVSLAIVVLLSVGLAMRFNAQNHILKEQFAESKQQQKLLALKNRQLKEEIKKRRLAEQQLEAQRTLRMRSDRLRSLGEMAAGMAHELNQPLVGVRGLAELIQVSMDGGIKISEETLRDNIHRILEQADRMVHIINHIRMFAREAGNRHASRVDINEVVRSGMSLLKAQFKSHGLSMEDRLHPEPLYAFVNPYSVEEVLLNLLTNSRHAVEKKYDRYKDSGFRSLVVIETGRSDHGTEENVWIKVSDNGMGICPSIEDKIFDPFFTTKDPDKGTGLGLSICKSIVEEFGGSIGFKSEKEKGAVFSVEFPACSANGENNNARE